MMLKGFAAGFVGVMLLWSLYRGIHAAMHPRKDVFQRIALVGVCVTFGLTIIYARMVLDLFGVR